MNNCTVLLKNKLITQCKKFHYMQSRVQACQSDPQTIMKIIFKGKYPQAHFFKKILKHTQFIIITISQTIRNPAEWQGVVGHLPGTHKVLDSIPSTSKNSNNNLESNGTHLWTQDLQAESQLSQLNLRSDLKKVRFKGARSYL